MNQRLPFYLTYPTEILLDEVYMENRDYDYMKSVYPDVAKRIMPYVEEACERMEYNGSMIFDEYPDQLQLRLICRRIYNKVKEEEEEMGEGLYDLIQVLTYHEIVKRRREYRKYRKKFY